MSNGTLNKVMLIGNLGKEPEVKNINGIKICNITIATSEKQKDKEDRVEWHSIVAFGKLAEIIEKYLNKGSKVYIEGHIQTRKWQDKETGKDKYKIEIIANTLKMLGVKIKQSNESVDKYENLFDEEIPF